MGAGRPFFVAGGVIETQKQDGPSFSADCLRRASELQAQLSTILLLHAPQGICHEAFSPPRHATNAAMLAMSLGVMAALAAHAGIPLQGKSPMGLKAALTGNRTASKAEMVEAAQREYPETASLFAPLPRDHHEHLADAVAAVHAFHGEAAP